MRHRIGVVIIALGTLGLASASLAILARSPGISTAAGRHLLAGALANASLAITLFLITVIPLRKRQRWALWALCLPMLFYGVPMLIVDAMNVGREQLFLTLGPQVGGLALFLAGLVLVGPAMFKRRHDA